MRQSLKIFLPLVGLAWIVSGAASGCVSVTFVTERGGELRWEVERRAPVILKFSKVSGCRVAFMPLVGGQFGIAAVAYANLALDSVMLKETGEPTCTLVSPAQSQDKLSRAGLVAPYAQMLRDFDQSGLIDETLVRRAADALGVDVIVAGRLVVMDADLRPDPFSAHQRGAPDDACASARAA